MSNNFAWDLFKNTGNVDAFMIMRNLENGSTNQFQNDNATNNVVLGGNNGDSKN